MFRTTLADQLMDAHAAGTVRAAIGRASDHTAHWVASRPLVSGLFDPALAGKTTMVLGDSDLYFTYLGDFARDLVTLGKHDEALGETWHLPSAETLSTRESASPRGPKRAIRPAQRGQSIGCPSWTVMGRPHYCAIQP